MKALSLTIAILTLATATPSVNAACFFSCNRITCATQAGWDACYDECVRPGHLMHDEGAVAAIRHCLIKAHKNNLMQDNQKAALRNFFQEHGADKAKQEFPFFFE